MIGTVDVPEEVGAAPSSHRLLAPLLSTVAYLLLSLLVWWNVWSGHPRSTTLCGCGDPSLFQWFLAWPAYAISHGVNPLYSTAMGYPHGVNLLANTSSVAIGVALAPITWIFGPIATFNVALFLSPVLSALAMFILVRRWVTWMPAAFVAGLLYGFSPFVLGELSDGHLMFGLVAVPPLVVVCLDELLVRQHRRSVPTGIVLGALLALQFFIGSELLLSVVVMGVLGVGMIALHAGVTDATVLREHVRNAWKGLLAALVVAVVLLAYPVWFAVAGPAHLSGHIWPSNLTSRGTSLAQYLVPGPSFHSPGGYQGHALSQGYFGFGLALVLLGGLVLWHRDKRLWFFAALGLLAVALGEAVVSPLVKDLPIFENVIPARFVLVVYLAGAVMLGVILDHVHRAVGTHRLGSSQRAIAGVAVAVLALAPVATYLAQNTPMTVRPVVLPTWFRVVAPQLPGRQVLLILPDSTAKESPMTWQAVNEMHYSMVNEGGPGGSVTRAGRDEGGENLFHLVSSALKGHKVKVVSTAALARQALSD